MDCCWGREVNDFPRPHLNSSSGRRRFGGVRWVQGGLSVWVTACAGEGQGEPTQTLPTDKTPTAVRSSGAGSAFSAGSAVGAEPAANAVTMAAAPQASVGSGGTVPALASGSSSTSGSEPTVPLAVPNEGRLLTRVQYDASVRDLFKGLPRVSFTGGFPAENEVMGFATDVRSHQASAWLVEAHLLASEAVAAEVVAALPQLLPCAATAHDAACAHAFVDEYGERAFRRELAAEERAPLVEAADEMFAGEGFDAAIALVVESLLQSPQFLYRMEYAAEQEAPEVYRVSDVEMATRLSYLFWSSIPDDELRERAREGRLHEVADIESQARRLAADPRTQVTLRDFTSQWLGIPKLDSVSRQTPLGAGTQLNSAWKASLSEFAVQSLWGTDGGVTKLLRSPTVYLTPVMAQVYGASIPEGTAADAVFAAEFPGQRYGLLTQPALMALLAHPEQSAPSQRGVFVREHVLCQPPPDPPPSVAATPPDPDPTFTTRERFRMHTQQPDCAGCHRMFDGLGLSLEGFDQAGIHRTQENGLPVDVSGEVYGSRDTSIQGAFDGPDELTRRLAGSYQVRDCLVTEWYRYSMGRFDETLDLVAVTEVAEIAQAAGGGFAEIMVRLALSEPFRFRTATVVDEALFQ